MQNANYCCPTILFIWKSLLYCSGGQWPPIAPIAKSVRLNTNYLIRLFIKTHANFLLVLVLQPKQMANTVRHYKISVTMVCSMNKNNIRNSQGKSKRRIVCFKSKICEIKNISFEIQIYPFRTICSRFCAEARLFSGYRSEYGLIIAIWLFNLNKNDRYVK